MPHPQTKSEPSTDEFSTGTTTVALTTADGVVLAADQRVTAGGRFVTSKEMQKVEQVHPTAALTLSGAVGGLQDYVRRLRSQVSLYETRRDSLPSMHATATFAGNLLRNGPYRAAQPTLGGVDDDGAHVYSFDGAGGVTEADYAAGGSGMQLVYGVLEREYRPDLSASEATDVAARAVQSALERDTASGNGLTVAEVTDEGVTMDTFDDPAVAIENGDDPASEVA